MGNRWPTQELRDQRFHNVLLTTIGLPKHMPYPLLQGMDHASLHVIKCANLIVSMQRSLWRMVDTAWPCPFSQSVLVLCSYD